MFTDHVFEGSNISSIIDIVAYSYHTLLFYLNRTSSESVFTEAQLYENINRIVKLLNYNPSGYKTAVLPFQAKGTMVPGNYTIPRYSFVDVGGVKYSLNTDIAFRKNTSTEETIENIGAKYLLYQGTFEEYPLQVSTGENFETFILTLPEDKKPDSYNIHVYVREGLTWNEYSLTESLFMETPAARKFEKRLNENKMFEIRFGNNIYGRRLNAGDSVAIYYLKSDQDKGVVGANALNGTLTPLSTSQFLQIRSNIKSDNTVYMAVDVMKQLNLSNTDASTKPQEEETVEDIKFHAPQFFNMQNRLITDKDYENYLNKQFGNIILDSKVVNNDQYIDGHLKYIVTTLGLQDPLNESRLAYNQFTFATSTNFNNVYIYAVPRFEKTTSTTPMVNFLSPAQRTAIVNRMQESKTLTSEPVVIDPVYMAVDIGAATTIETLDADMVNTSKLNILKSKDSQKDNDTIRNEAITIIKKYFGTAVQLGHTFKISDLFSELADISDVVDVYMSRDDNSDVNTQGITFMCWNPVFPTKDISIISQNTTFPYFKFPYLYDTPGLSSKILISTSVK